MRGRAIRAGGLALVAAAIGLSAFGGRGGGAVADTESAGVGTTFTIYSSLPLQGDSRPQSEDIVRAMQMALRDQVAGPAATASKYVSLDDATGSSAAGTPSLSRPTPTGPPATTRHRLPR